MEKFSKSVKITLAALLTVPTSVIVFTYLVGGAIALHAHFQHQFELSQEALLNRAKDAQASNNYHGCMAEAREVHPDSKTYDAAQALLKVCQHVQAAIDLRQAQAMATEGRLAEAIALASEISASPSYATAQSAAQAWSEQILETARQQYWQSDQLDTAIAIANTIPENSPSYTTAQAQIERWRVEWANNERYWQSAHKALRAGEWIEVLNAVDQITLHPYWRQKAEQMARSANEGLSQEHYEDIWRTAKRFLAQGEPQNAAYAAYQLPDDFPWGERKTKLVEAATALSRRTTFCHRITLGLLDCQQ